MKKVHVRKVRLAVIDVMSVMSLLKAQWVEEPAETDEMLIQEDLLLASRGLYEHK